MSIQGQFGLGTSGFNLVTTIREGLSLCTTDGVTGVALTFLDAFGARFAVSPYLCSRIREVCVSDQSTTLGRLKVAVGYRKGDASALLANSNAGLSAIAFIIVLTEMFGNEDIAWIMKQMVPEAISSSITFPSTREICRCINVIHHRCASFEFCTHYAEIVTAIRQTRLTKGSAGASDNLTRPPSPEDAMPLLRRVLSCMRDDNTQHLIEGNESMGIIAAAVSWWFPRSVQIVSEDMVIWPCEQSATRCIVRVASGAKTQWWDETMLSSLDTLIPHVLPTLTQFRDARDRWPDWTLQYPIAGFAGGALASLGFPEGAERERACLLIASLAYRLAWSLHIRSSGLAVTKSFIEYIGSPGAALHFLTSSLKLTCGCALSQTNASDFTLLQELEEMVVIHLSSLLPTDCNCRKCPSKASEGWFSLGTGDCPLSRLRSFIGELILKVFLHVLIDSDYDFRLSIGSNIPELQAMLPTIASVWSGKQTALEAGSLYRGIAAFLGVAWSEEYPLIGSSRHGVCIYLPTAIWPEVGQENLVRIRVARGAFIHRDMYYSKLKIGVKLAQPEPAIQASEPLTAKTRLETAFSKSLQMIQYSVRDLVEDLKLTVTIRDSLGLQQQINLAAAISHARFAIRVESCGHLTNAFLDPNYEDLSIVKTSIAASGSVPAKICVIGEYGDRQACLYACDSVKRPVITHAACLNCAIKRIQEWKNDVGQTVIQTEDAGFLILRLE